MVDLPHPLAAQAFKKVLSLTGGPATRKSDEVQTVKADGINHVTLHPRLVDAKIP